MICECDAWKLPDFSNLEMCYMYYCNQRLNTDRVTKKGIEVISKNGQGPMITPTDKINLIKSIWKNSQELANWRT